MFYRPYPNKPHMALGSFRIQAALVLSLLALTLLVNGQDVEADKDLGNLTAREAVLKPTDIQERPDQHLKHWESQTVSVIAIAMMRAGQSENLQLNDEFSVRSTADGHSHFHASEARGRFKSATGHAPISARQTQTVTIHVPDDYSTVQEAVNAANPGDTIIVRAGTYSENLDVDKRLDIVSANGTELTAIEAAESSSTVPISTTRPIWSMRQERI